MKQAALYLRVSSPDQATEDKESLKLQDQDGRAFIERQGWGLYKVYADKGISGRDMEKREALKELLRDAEAGKFQAVVVKDMTRFGRDQLDSLTNINALEELRVEFRTIDQDVDYSGEAGPMLKGIFASVAEWENRNRTRRMMKTKQSKANNGKAQFGPLPFGRTFNKETGEWGVDTKKRDLIRSAAQEYIKGKPLIEAVKELELNGIKMTYHNLFTILTKKCGPEWRVNFYPSDWGYKKKMRAEAETVIFKVPELLDAETIRKVHERVQTNKCNTRVDVKHYPLSGFIRCEHCGATLTGQSQRGGYVYYRHISVTNAKDKIPCKACRYVPAPLIENAIFKTLFQNIHDEIGFQRAIKNYLPDQKMIDLVNESINQNEAELKELDKKEDNLIKLIEDGARPGKIKARLNGLYERQDWLKQKIEEDKNRLESFPSIEEVKREGEKRRRIAMLYFGSMERLKTMTFDEKREMLYWLFAGKDSEGTSYGIYITTKAKGVYDYFIYGRLIEGLRTVRGSDIDYYPDEKEKAEVIEFKGEDLNYKTSNVYSGKTLTHGKPRQ